MIKEQLEHKELLNLKLAKSFPNNPYLLILSPNQIPVHPSVYTNPSFYTSEFYGKILERLDESVENDAHKIKEILGLPIVTEKEDIKYWTKIADSERKSIDFGCIGSNIAIQPDSNIERILECESDFPNMTKERAMTFSMSQDKLSVPTWYQHTPTESGISVFMYLRNFAILFNNLGVQELNK